MIEDILNYIRLIIDFKIKNENSDVWWRGTSDFTYELKPSVYRNDSPGKEHNSHFRFMRKAVSIYPKCPGETEYLNWLFLMQHYGLPTRLLDWSESALVALYFTSNEIEKHNKDGALYALLPSKLNNFEVERNAIILPHDDLVQKISHEAFNQNKNGPKKICALFPPLTDVRQVMQHSVFTIHGKTDSLSEPPFLNNSIFKFKVLKEHKKGVLEMIKMLGLNRSSLFPDLENLSKEIAELKFVIR